jgi:hypothetical protein
MTFLDMLHRPNLIFRERSGSRCAAVNRALLKAPALVAGYLDFFSDLCPILTKSLHSSVGNSSPTVLSPMNPELPGSPQGFMLIIPGAA